MSATGRAAVRWRLLGLGAVLVAGPLLAPLLSPALILPASLLWYAVLALLLQQAHLVLTTWMRSSRALLLLGALVALPLILATIRPGPRAALYWPCPRNYGWLPAWLLRSSPLVSLRFTVGTADLKLCYGRPAARGRRMLGGSQVPYGRLWRTGANEPTVLIITDSVDIGGIRVQPGRVAIYTIPGPESWEVILNVATTQWGIESEYRSAIRAWELGRVILPSLQGDFVERLHWSVERSENDANAVNLVLAWETTRLRVPIRAPLR